MTAKISRSHAGAGSKRQFGGDILLVKLAKLSNGVVSCVIASAAAARVMSEMRALGVPIGTRGAKGS
jgi:ribosomal protein L28